MIASIDIGTSYSSICVLGPDGKAQPVDISTGASMFGSKYSLPSAVFAEDGGGILVGQAAMNSRKHKPQNFHMEFKRNLGEDAPILLGERSFRPEALYTELFRHMKARAEKLTGEPIEKAYLTYPASYGKKRRERLCSAANAAGLFDLELVDEPTAAAMHYCSEGYVKDGQILLVYDFGGGTFDVSLILYRNSEFELLSEPLGLERCGGMDIDYLIGTDMQGAIEKKMPGALENLRQNPNRALRFTSQLHELAVKAKHHLSDANRFEEYIEVGMDDVYYQLDVERFNGMIAGLVGDTLKICRQALDEAGVSPSEVSAVLMVGGTSRIPLVQEMARRITGKPALCAADLELIVAQGALVYNEYQNMERKRQDEAEAHEKAQKMVVDVHNRSLSADEYFKMGQEAAKRKAWNEAVDHYYKAASMGHSASWKELDRLSNSKKGEDLHKKIIITLEEAAFGCTKDVEVKDFSETRKLNVVIPAGIENGQSVCLKGQGGTGKNYGSRGDLYIDINILPHPLFRRAGLDLYYEAKVPYIRASKGGEIETPTLGAKLYFKIPPNTKDGTVYTIQGKGIPSLDGQIQGNLLITIHVQEPSAEDCYQLAQQCDPVHHMEEAANWYQKAAEQGHAGAAYNLGLCYASHWGVATNYRKAAEWFCTAAENGHGQAAYMLGTYYKEGKGVPKDNVQSKRWLKRAAELGHITALRELVDVSETIRSEETAFVLTITRKKQFALPNPPMQITIDEEQTLNVANGASTKVKLTQGKHKIDISWFSFVYRKHMDIMLNSDSLLLITWKRNSYHLDTVITPCH